MDLQVGFHRQISRKSNLMLSIFEIDLHRDELRALGLVGELRIDSALMAP